MYAPWLSRRGRVCSLPGGAVNVSSTSGSTPDGSAASSSSWVGSRRSIQRVLTTGERSAACGRNRWLLRRGRSDFREVLLLLEEALGVERGHRARAGGGDRLAVRVILHVARGEDARDVRSRRARLRDEVALLVVVEPVEEERWWSGRGRSRRRRRQPRGRASRPLPCPGSARRSHARRPRRAPLRRRRPGRTRSCRSPAHGRP